MARFLRRASTVGDTPTEQIDTASAGQGIEHPFTWERAADTGRQVHQRIQS
jgi:hypothetical protein